MAVYRLNVRSYADQIDGASVIAIAWPSNQGICSSMRGRIFVV